jgi:hypothetical protein
MEVSNLKIVEFNTDFYHVACIDVFNDTFLFIVKHNTTVHTTATWRWDTIVWSLCRIHINIICLRTLRLGYQFCVWSVPIKW